MRRVWSDWTLPGYLAVCLTLGGSSGAGYLANGVVQVIGLAVIAAILWRKPHRSPSHPESIDTRALWWMTSIFIGWVVLQLVPLPPAIWHALPGRGFVQADDALLGVNGVWRPLSLQPSSTLISAMGIVPPIAMLLLGLRASATGRARAAWTIIGIAVLSSVLGIVQLFQSTSGGAYFYSITNYGATVGFFSNANHLSTLFLVAIVISAELPFGTSRSASDRMPVWNIVRWALVGFFTVNVIVNGSVAGMGLLLAAIAYVILRRTAARKVFGSSKIGLTVLAIILVLAIGIFVQQFSGELSTFANTSVPGEDRLEFATNTLHMIASSFPFGYGLGSFRVMYTEFENPLTITSTYVNHAHNDYLETVSDMGVFAIILLGIFTWWFIRRLRWLVGATDVESYTYAMAMVILLIAGHSLVDYPLRTAAIGAIFAFACACLAHPYPELRDAGRRTLGARDRRTPRGINRPSPFRA